MNKQIYINGRFLMQPPTGVQRYAYEICKALCKCGTDFTLICPKKGVIDKAYDVSLFNIKRYGIGASHLWEQLVLPFFFLGKRDYVLINFTGLGSIAVPNKIMTVHDLSFLVCRQWFSRAYYCFYKPMTWLAVKTSKHLITVSEFSKSEILRLYTFLHEDRIHVIYNAADNDKFKPASTFTKNDFPYCLSVSSLDPRKNFSRLLEAFKDVEGCKLLIVGGANKVFSQNQDLKQSENIEFLGRVSDEELIRLYQGAEAFLFPSLYEGFGLPVVEAMCVGCPVIASDIPVLREVCGDAAIYFNPNDSDDMRNKIHSYLDDKQRLKPIMTEKGKENVMRFSWKSSAQKLIKLLNTL
ncbi:MAG: glycosyltransferase family 4 protein [Prevotella sp.]|nr:glycosyltransferase family 4 protein [Prevotella sp.]